MGRTVYFPYILPYPIGSMGLVYLPTWMVAFYGFHVGEYASPMDPMGMNLANCR